MNEIGDIAVGKKAFVQEHQESAAAKYRVGEEIGRGAFAQVKELWNRATGEERAMKIYHVLDLTESERRSVATEVNILK